MTKYLILPTQLVVQGGMAYGISGPKLVAAVANAGGTATLAGSGLKPEQLRTWIQEARQLTDKPFGVNLMTVLYDFMDLLQVCIDEKVLFVAMGAGFKRDPYKMLKEAGIPAFVIISSLRAAQMAYKFGATSIIVEAPKDAGGHLGVSADKDKSPEEYEIQLNSSIWDLLSEIVPNLRDAGFRGAIIAAGGILTGSDIKRAFDLGASGVQMGIRFAMSQESGATDLVKKAWIDAKGTKVIISPVGLPGRVIDDQEKDSLPTIQDIERCVRCLTHCGREYCIFDSLINATEQGVSRDKILIFAGSRVSEIDDIPSVSTIFRRLAKEYLLALLEGEP